jgi:putative transposase
VNRQTIPIALMCRVYGVTRAGFYAWLHRGPSQRARQEETLAQQIKRVHQASRGTYGSPRAKARGPLAPRIFHIR